MSFSIWLRDALRIGAREYAHSKNSVGFTPVRYRPASALALTNIPAAGVSSGRRRYQLARAPDKSAVATGVQLLTRRR